MARIRTIKPEFWSSEQVMECQPLTRLLFIGIWNFCDDGGNHPDSEKTIKARVFPGDELSSNGLLSFYEHSGKQYLHVCGWEHQRIDKPTFKYPEFVQPLVVSSPPLLGTGTDDNQKPGPVAKLATRDAQMGNFIWLYFGAKWPALRIARENDMGEAKARELIKAGVAWIDCAIEVFSDAV